MAAHRVHGGSALKVLPQPGAPPGHLQQPAPPSVHTPLSTPFPWICLMCWTPQLGVGVGTSLRGMLFTSGVDIHVQIPQSLQSVRVPGCVGVCVDASLPDFMFARCPAACGLASPWYCAALAQRSEQRCMSCQKRDRRPGMHG